MQPYKPTEPAKQKKETSWVEFLFYAFLTIAAMGILTHGINYLLQIAVEHNNKIQVSIQISKQPN